MRLHIQQKDYMDEKFCVLSAWRYLDTNKSSRNQRPLCDSWDMFVDFLLHCTVILLPYYVVVPTSSYRTRMRSVWTFKHPCIQDFRYRVTTKEESDNNFYKIQVDS